jgi:hypothetical protein
MGGITIVENSSIKKKHKSKTRTKVFEASMI